MSAPILHLTARADWAAATTDGAYRADSLAGQGFIHCSTAAQLLRVANSFYAGQHGLVVLVLDPGKLRSPVRWEPGSDKPDELFPHVYGPIDLEAVVRVLDYEPGPDGRFAELPPV